LTQIDPSNIKTYQDLETSLGDKITQVAQLQDKALGTRPEAINLQDLTVKGHNFVNDALDQLQQYYEKTNNIDGQNQIAELKNKAQTQGLTIKEVNDLARQHGQDLNAYNANGELASGLNKQAAENTRQGLKTTVRQYMGDQALQGSDSQLSDLINTRSLVNQVAEKANALGQKIQQRGLLAKIGYYSGKAVDMLSGGTLKNFVNYFIPRGEGLKTLNALDLEKGLQKNLQLLQSLDSGSLSDADFTSKLNGIIDQGNPAAKSTLSKVMDATSQGIDETNIGLSSRNVNPQAEELGQKINDLNKQYVSNPTPANKQALDSALQLYKQAIKVGGTAAAAFGLSKNVKK
jgi:hypothetical protein